MSTKSGAETLESMSQAVWYNQWTLKKFQQFLNGEILEVGCGIGNFTKTLAKFGNVTAIDINEEYIKKVKNKLDDKVKIGYGNIETGKYFFNKGGFDCIVCINVLEHIKDDQTALTNMYKLLKKDGYLILLVPAFDFLYGEIDKSIGHFRRYNREDLHGMLNVTGLKIIKSRFINFLGGLGWWISAKILSNNKVDESKIKIFNFVAPFVLPLEDLVEPPLGTSILVIAQR